MDASVRQVRVEFTCADRDTAFRARTEQAEHIERSVRAALEAALPDLDGMDVRLDRIEIDLGRFDPGRPDLERLTRLLAQAVSDAMAATPEGEPPRAVRVPTAVSHLETLGRFLRSGTLGWDASVATVAELGERVRGIIANAERGVSSPIGAVALRAALREALRTRAARQRLVEQFDPDVVDTVIRELAPSDGRRPARPADAGEIDRALGGGASPAAAHPETRSLRGPSPDLAGRPAPGSAAADDPATARDENAADSPEPESTWMRVDHAGLVLLHPFLRCYFEACGLVDSGAFVSRGARHAGAHLLHFLATGRQGCDEHTLAWPRMLVGCGPGDPTPRRFEPEQAWLDEGRALLASVLEHWDALGRTSSEGLRETFLQRPGVVRTGEAIAVHVERRGVDVLLDRLPWGLSVFKLPWLGMPIHVEW